MDSSTASKIIRRISVKRAEQKVSSSFTRYKMGLTKSTCARKRVIFSQSDFQAEPFAGWWMMINYKDTTESIIAKEAVKLVLKHANPAGRAMGAIGSSGVAGKAIAGAHSVHGMAGDVKTVKSMFDGDMASGIVDQWNGAWKAGTWSAAKGTAQEFAMGWDAYMLGGFVSMAEPDATGTVAGRIYLTPDKDQMLRYMAAEERAGGLKHSIKRINEHLGWVGTLNFMYEGSSDSVQVD